MTKLMRDARQSWKTTTAGILAAVLIIGEQVLFSIDSDPGTTLDMNIIIAQIIITIGLIRARDNDVSSEQAGAK